MSELLPPPPSTRTCGFGDPALVFPEFAAKQQCVLEKVVEVEGEGEDSSYGKGSFDLSSRFSGSSISPNDSVVVDIPKKTPSLKLSGFPEEEEIDDHYSRISGSFADRIGQEEKRKRCFRTCCAVTCMLVSILLIIVLLTGLSVNSSINSKLPQVYVTNLKFSRLDITKSSTDLLLNSNLNTVLELSNKNDKTVLDYGPMRADVSSENINLGQKQLVGFKQNPGDVTSLKIATRRRKASVYDVDSTLLTNKEKKSEAVVNVFVRGKLSFEWLGFSLHLPIVIACEEVKQSDVIKRLKPQCDVRIFS